MINRAYKPKSGCTWIDFCNQCGWQLIKQSLTHFRVVNLGASDRNCKYQWTFRERKKVSFLPGKCKDLDKLTNISPGEKGSNKEQNPVPSQRLCSIWDAYCQFPQQCVHSGERGRIAQGSPRALATSAKECSLTCNLVSWARYLTEEKTLQFPKLHCSAVSWGFVLTPKYP